MLPGWLSGWLAVPNVHSYNTAPVHKMAHVSFARTHSWEIFPKNVFNKEADGSVHIATLWGVTQGPRPPNFPPGDAEKMIDEWMTWDFIRKARALQREWDAEEKKAEAGAEWVKRRKSGLGRQFNQE